MTNLDKEIEKRFKLAEESLSKLNYVELSNSFRIGNYDRIRATKNFNGTFQIQIKNYYEDYSSPWSSITCIGQKERKLDVLNNLSKFIAWHKKQEKFHKKQVLKETRQKEKEISELKDSLKRFDNHFNVPQEDKKEIQSKIDHASKIIGADLSEINIDHFAIKNDKLYYMPPKKSGLSTVFIIIMFLIVSAYAVKIYESFH